MTRKEKIYLTLIISLVLFLTTLITVALTAGAMTLMVGVFWNGTSVNMTPTKIILIMALMSIVTGLLVSFGSSKIPMYPIQKVMTHMDRLASGNYDSSVEFTWPLNKIPSFIRLSKRCNKLAEELDSNEMLKSDFINDFSHEVKTPIVSIRGFARLLKSENLSDEKKAEYAGVIERESERLAKLATNVMNMTRVENMAILPDLSTFNLSEQIRSCILLFENKWTEKNIEMDLDFDEYEITANRDLLKEVWINLIDNALKFSEPGGTIFFNMLEQSHNLLVSVTNEGEDIPIDVLPKLFNRFYQADESHAAEGHGIGLPIVKRIAQLHGGDVSVTSENGRTTFTVILPLK